MKFRTEIPLKKQEQHLVDYNANLLLIGSCFSENIGNKLSYYKFSNLVNPYGILFHPLAVEKTILEGTHQFQYTKNDLYFHDKLWLSLHHHTKFSSYSLDETLTRINNGIECLHSSLKKASHIIITLGTAWIYRFLETDTIVANCHKIPQKKFAKEILSIPKITKSLELIISLINSLNKKASIIFTVSPIRHLKDGFIENQQSKAYLIAAIHQVIASKNIFYFPAYEIMMDELRDYRFYKEDMVHLNQTAINYIWEKFMETWISKAAIATMQEVDSIQKGLLHKPFNPTSEKHQDFLKKITIKKNELQLKFPTITF